MVFYHLSGAQILRIFRKPNRREEGIAPNTVACMQTKLANRVARNVNRANQESKLKAHSNKLKAPSEEIWIMYKLNSLNAKTSKPKASRITLISAWRYPGVTKAGERPPIPEDVAEMLEKGIY